MNYTKEQVEKVLMKGVEFIQCCKHMHMRGMGEVSREVGDIMTAEKMTGKKLVEDVEEMFGGKVNLEEDAFLKMLCENFKEE